MAFRKLLAIAACLSVSYAAPQYLANAGLGGATLIRAGGFNSLLGNQAFVTAPAARTVVSHATAPAVRTAVVAAPAVRTAVVAAPAVRTVATHAAPTVVRTIEQPIQEVTTTHLAHDQQVEIVDENPSYSFGYSVQDASSGDFKTREESSENGVTTGSYTVSDPDGRIRRVNYQVTPETGYQAEVTYDGQYGPPAINNDASEVVANTAVAVDEGLASDVISVEGRGFLNNGAVQTLASPAAVVRTQAVQAVHAPALRTVATHAAPTVVRTQAVHAATPLVRTVAHAAPTVVRTQAVHTATPVVRTVATHAAPTVVRTAGFHAATPTFVRSAAFHAAPTVVRTNALHASPLAVRAFPSQTLLHV